MLGRFSAPLRRRQAMMSRRSLATNPWLSDKSVRLGLIDTISLHAARPAPHQTDHTHAYTSQLYPMLAICGAAVLFAAWFAPMHLYKKPETQYVPGCELLFASGSLILPPTPPYT